VRAQATSVIVTARSPSFIGKALGDAEIEHLHERTRSGRRAT
jgi:hypothetical protein